MNIRKMKMIMYPVFRKQQQQVKKKISPTGNSHKGPNGREVKK